MRARPLPFTALFGETRLVSGRSEPEKSTNGDFCGPILAIRGEKSSSVDFSWGQG